MTITKGQIYKIYFHTSKKSHLQSGVRPALIISGNKKNQGNIIHVVPLTTQHKRNDLGTHAIISGYGLERESIALTEQVLPVDRYLINQEYYIGTVTDKKLLDRITTLIYSQFE